MTPTNSKLTNNTPQSEEVTQPSQQQLASPVQEIVRQVPQQPLQSPPGLSHGQDRSLMPPPNEPPHPQSLIPEVLISRDTIEYVGFTPQAAAKMWNAWVEWPRGLVRREIDPDDGRPYITFLEFMIRHIVYAEDATSSEAHKWDSCMERYGFSKSMQESVRQFAGHPQLAQVNCSYWSKMIVLLHYEVLQGLQRTCPLHMIRPDRTRHRALPLRFRR
ncbi:hypothetical protein NCS57_00439700 [Fusarium keratoplasticum]|uniref:Uncharacterized protein n=1 Tax=Fusarium keratoplasticum TaxID=1328300 RepID=A0ACC0R8U4_9HYPO|nr:hypothetical protein NCS57_00439700 [Fusarium keratoplasticum]KAI8675386.1 hypothetical protein NCS57_00439700 [Fusarium keratoplasticum]